MPHVQITMLKGRTLEQKRKLATRITDVMEQEAKTPARRCCRDRRGFERDSFARGGEHMVDKE